MTQVDSAVSPVHRRKRPKKLPAHAFDRRTRMGRRAVPLAATFGRRLGQDAADPILQVQIERAARLVAFSKQLSARSSPEFVRHSPLFQPVGWMSGLPPIQGKRAVVFEIASP